MPVKEPKTSKGDKMARERYGEETEDGNALVIDCAKEGGVELIIQTDDTNCSRFFLYDEEAQELVNIIQNKLNARLR